MRQLCNLVLARTKKDMIIGSLLRSYAIGSQYKCGHLMTLTVEPDNLIYDNCEVVEPYLVDGDKLCVGDLVYHHIWEIVGTIISINGGDIEVDWGDFKHSHYRAVKVGDLRNVIGLPEQIGYLAHGYGNNPDDAFYDLMSYADYGPLLARGCCYVEYENVLRHGLSGRILKKWSVNMNLNGYDWVWVPKELKGKYIIHYDEK